MRIFESLISVFPRIANIHLYSVLFENLGLSVFQFNLFDKLQLSIWSLTNIQTIRTHIRFLN
jgi:hypothetical protein